MRHLISALVNGGLSQMMPRRFLGFSEQELASGKGVARLRQIRETTSVHTLPSKDGHVSRSFGMHCGARLCGTNRHSRAVVVLKRMAHRRVDIARSRCRDIVPRAHRQG